MAQRDKARRSGGGPRRGARATARTSSLPVLWVTMLVGVAIIAGILLLMQRPGPAVPDVARNNTKGADTAPVVVTDWSDFL